MRSIPTNGRTTCFPTPRVGYSTVGRYNVMRGHASTVELSLVINLLSPSNGRVNNLDLQLLIVSVCVLRVCV